jgi:hypothetical protein
MHWSRIFGMRPATLPNPTVVRSGRQSSDPWTLPSIRFPRLSTAGKTITDDRARSTQARSGAARSPSKATDDTVPHSSTRSSNAR